MIDSTNPRSMADNIRHLAGTSGSQASDISNLQTTVEALGSYSTNEVDTGKTWIDGTPIYRKCVYIENFPNASSMEINIGDTAFTDIINIYGFMPESSGFAGRPLPYSTAAIFRWSSGKLYVVTSGDYSSYSGYIVIEYIKAAPSSLTSPAPDDTRSIEPEEIPEDEYIEPEVREEIPEEEPVQEVKKTTRKKSTN